VNLEHDSAERELGSDLDCISFRLPDVFSDIFALVYNFIPSEAWDNTWK
jgi:hypothetical protein